MKDGANAEDGVVTRGSFHCADSKSAAQAVDEFSKSPGVRYIYSWEFKESPTNFLWAVNQARSGQRVRRRSWPFGTYLLAEEGFLANGNTEQDLYLSVEDYAATDWEIL